MEKRTFFVHTLTVRANEEAITVTGETVPKQITISPDGRSFPIAAREVGNRRVLHYLLGLIPGEFLGYIKDGKQTEEYTPPPRSGTPAENGRIPRDKQDRIAPNQNNGFGVF